MRRLTHAVTPPEEGRRLDGLLRGALGLSAHRISSLKFRGGILLDGAPTHTDARVRAGQVIEALLEDAPADIAPYALPLRILYRDEDLAVVDKPAPLPSIHSARQDEHTLENALFAALGCPERFVYRPVSRLDKGTSGLMPVALTAHAHDRRQRQLHTADYVREYLAVVEGCPPELEGVCAAPIGRAEGVRRCVDPAGRPAVTHYRVLRQGKNGRSLLRLRLETGRTHQIRVHMQFLGCPVAGDYLYGTPLEALPGRFALHSAQMQFAHPVTGQMMNFESPLPEALEALLG